MFKRIGTLWIIITLGLAILFTVGCVVGWFLPDELKLNLIQSVLVKFESILARSSTDWSLALNIFLNNLLVAVIILVSAILPFVPLVIVFANGMIIGVFGDLLWRLNYIQAGTFTSAAISLIPHGIFELSAIFLAGSLGLVAFIKLVMPGRIQPSMTRGSFLLMTLKWFGLAVIPLLMIAGVVEAFISPRIAEMLATNTNSSADSPYTVQLQPLALAQTNCIPGTTSNLASVASDQLSLLYDPAVSSLLRTRSQVPQWQTTYSCPQGGWFTVASFAAEQWSPEQAHQLVIAMLDHLQANYTEPSSLVVETKISEINLRYQILALSNRTIVITHTDLPFLPETLLSPVSTE